MAKHGKRNRFVRIAVAAASALIIALGAFPWGILRETIETQLSKEFERPVSIGSMRRLDLWSFHPRIAIRDVVIPQAAWAGEGEMIRIAEAEIRVLVPSLIAGKLVVDAVDISGAKLALVRDADGRKNWKKEAPRAKAAQKRPSGKKRSALRRLTISDATVSYSDAKQDLSVVASVDADERAVSIVGDGFIHKSPVKVVATGAAVTPKSAEKSWPFRAEIIGGAISIVFDGEMDGPLDTGHFIAEAAAHAQDLALIDAVIEAGLMPTQPVIVAAKVRRESPDWKISDLTGTIGRSDIAGDATIKKRDGRTLIDGTLRA